MNSNDSSNVIVRFAPSPTGALHIGSVRTALFNWLYARHCNGKFLLRIEDTDKIRSTQENTNLIFDVLKWLAMDYNDTAIIQSSRLDRHKEVAHELVKNGMAYFCCCSQEELAAKKEVALKEGKAYKYDRNCRDLKHDNKSCPAVIRLKSEILGETTVDDMVQGSVTVDNSQLDDLVLLRSDGTPTYMLSVVVDDHDMNVTHVIRGDDHLTNTFRQIQIYRACGWNIPRFGHIPLIYGPDSAKLSKRHGAVSASEYRDLGYLPEALCNYLLRLGWSHGDSEIISRDEAIEWFDFASVGKSPSRFDINKLNHLNSHYIRQKDDAALFEYTLPFIGRDIDDTTKSKILRGMKGLKERADTIVALAKSCMVYVDAPNSYDEKSNKFTTETHVSLVEKFIDIIESAKDDLEEHSMLESAKEIAILNNVKLVEVAQSLRVAITGTTISPSVFEIISILGKEESILRLNNFVKTFRK